MRPSGCGGAGGDAALALLDDAQRHRLRRAAWHLPPRRSERGPSQFSDELLGPLGKASYAWMMGGDLDFVVEAVEKAGKLILRYFGESYRVQYKNRDNPVTPADHSADSFLREAFARRFPNDGWLSEETADDLRRLSLARVWVVDPLDGTKEFIRGFPEFAVSVALVEHGEAHLAVVHNPSKGDLFVAEAGKGAFRNGELIRVSPRDRLAGAHILASRSEHLLFGKFQGWTKVQALGSIAYKLGLVAARTGDMTISFRPKSEWDVCAGSLIVQEAGGKVTDLKGNALAFNRPDRLVAGIIAANAQLHEQALRWIQQHAESFLEL